MRKIQAKIITWIMVFSMMLGIINTNGILVYAASSSKSKNYTTYTEKEQTTTGIRIGKTYRIYHITVKYSYKDCVRLKKQTANLSGNGATAASIVAGYIPGTYGVFGAIVSVMGMSASNYNKIFSNAVKRKKGIVISYDWWVCMNGTSADNKGTNYKMKYK